MKTVTRVFEFDAAHRVMHEKVKCFNLHGHRFKVEATFEYEDLEKLGYAIDFKELKRVCGEFLDIYMDHATLLNPLDTELIELCQRSNWRYWIMGLGNTGDINPSAENIASEIFSMFNLFFNINEHHIRIKNIRLYETPNCWVDVSETEYEGNSESVRGVLAWRGKVGNYNYDVRENG